MITILSALVIAFFLCGFIGGRIYYDRRCPNFSDKAEIYVYPNMNISDVMEEIVSKDVCGAYAQERLADSRENGVVRLYTS